MTGLVDHSVDETPEPPAPPVSASKVETGPVQTVIVEDRPWWELVADRGCMILLGAAVGMVVTLGLVAL